MWPNTLNIKKNISEQILPTVPSSAKHSAPIRNKNPLDLMEINDCKPATNKESTNQVGKQSHKVPK